MDMVVPLKEIVPVDGLSKPRGVWSTAVVAQPGRLVFVSGLLAKNEAGDVVGVGDVAAQTDQILSNLSRTLQCAGGSLDDIVRVDVFVRDISQFDAIHGVRRKYFPKNPPASTMVEVSRLTDERCLIEINAIAVVP